MWNAIIRPIKGGIQKTDDFYLNEAPLNNYEPFLIEGNNAGLTNTDILRDQHYYFFSHNKKHFGGLKVTYKPFANKDYCHFVIEYKINENGSRNLAIRY